MVGKVSNPSQVIVLAEDEQQVRFVRGYLKQRGIGNHAIRVECALVHLPFQPLREFGLEKMVAEARGTVSATLGGDVVEWLPDARRHFDGL